jgi:pimeloyl-ACP methyl ester carboxylesterase
MVTDEAAAEAVNALKDGRALRIDNVGHMIPWDDLDGFLSAVNGFIEGTS